MSERSIWNILVVIAAVLLLIGNVAIWVNRSLADTDRFVETAAAELKNQETREAIAEQIVFAIMGDQQLVYQLAGDAAERAVTQLLATPGFQALLTLIATNLHQMIITGERPTITIGADFLPLIVEAIFGAIGGGPLFDAPDQEIEIELFANRDIASLEWLVDPLQKIGLPCLLAGIVILALSIIVADDRRRGLRRAAIAASAALAITLLAIVPLRSLYLSRIDGDVANAIAPKVLGTLTNQLFLQTLLLLIPCIVLGALSLRQRTALTPAPAGEA
ncbi:MAG TPA: hypothetical protein VEX37_08195 [Thermomicrobiales bacterium]|nr:hypothetical protein [Thermomicrobiales bacterium]